MSSKALQDIFEQLSLAPARPEASFLDAMRQLSTNPTLANLQSFLRIALDLEQYETAGKVLDSVSPEIANASAVLVPKAYVYYKLGAHEKLRELVKTSDGNSRGLSHIYAQDRYGAGDFAAAINVYEKLLTTPAQMENEAQDLAVNELSLISEYILSSSVDVCPLERRSQAANDSYDRFFNEAILSFARGSFNDAFDHLNKAQTICESSLLSPEDIKQELVPIQLLKAYFHHVFNQPDEAAVVLNGIDIDSVSDAGLKAILINNKAALKPVANPNVLLRQLQTIPQEKVMDRFIFRQKKQYQFIIDSLKLAAGRRSRLFAVFSKVGVNQDDPIPYKIHALKKYLEKHPEGYADASVVLILAQLYILAGKKLAATLVLERYVQQKQSDFSYGVIGALVALYDTQGRSRVCLQLLEKVYSSMEDTIDPYATSLLLEIAYRFLQENSPTYTRIAGEIFVNLFAKTKSTAVKVGVAATIDEAESGIKMSDLLDVDSLVADVDVEAVLAAGVTPLLTKKRPVEKMEVEKPKKARKLSAKRTPANFEPGKAVDPERWLPLKDRSTYRPKKGKKAKKNETQGGTADNTTEVGYEAKASQSSSNSSSNKNKKKKKGKR